MFQQQSYTHYTGIWHEHWAWHSDPVSPKSWEAYESFYEIIRLWFFLNELIKENWRYKKKKKTLNSWCVKVTWMKHQFRISVDTFFCCLFSFSLLLLLLLCGLLCVEFNSTVIVVHLCLYMNLVHGTISIKIMNIL